MDARLKADKLKMVWVRGNGFCLLKSIQTALATEHGLGYSDALIYRKVMEYVRGHLAELEQFHCGHLLKDLDKFFMNGSYMDDVVDLILEVCVKALRVQIRVYHLSRDINSIFVFSPDQSVSAPRSISILFMENMDYPEMNHYNALVHKDKLEESMQPGYVTHFPDLVQSMKTPSPPKRPKNFPGRKTSFRTQVRTLKAKTKLRAITPKPPVPSSRATLRAIGTPTASSTPRSRRRERPVPILPKPTPPMTQAPVVSVASPDMDNSNLELLAHVADLASNITVPSTQPLQRPGTTAPTTVPSSQPLLSSGTSGTTVYNSVPSTGEETTATVFQSAQGNFYMEVDQLEEEEGVIDLTGCDSPGVQYEKCTPEEAMEVHCESGQDVYIAMGNPSGQHLLIQHKEDTGKEEVKILQPQEEKPSFKDDSSFMFTPPRTIQHWKGSDFPIHMFVGKMPERREECPDDIDGLAYIIVQNVPADNWLARSNDRRHFNLKQSTRIDFKGVRKTGWCHGSWCCVNPNCPYLHCSEEQPNRHDFYTERGTTIKKCATCGYLAERKPCFARKLVEYDLEEQSLAIYHVGNHSCNLKPLSTRSRKLIKPILMAEDFKKPPKQIQREKILEHIPTNSTWDFAKAREAARLWSDTTQIRNIQQEAMASDVAELTSFDALAEMKASADAEDKFLMYKINNGKLNNDPDYVFKTSQNMLDIMELLDADGDKEHPLTGETVYFDGIAKRVLDFHSLGLWLYHPIMNRLIRLASMDVKSENTVNIELFFRLVNEALEERTEREGYKFNPGMIMCDELGSNHVALKNVFGEEFATTRVVTCQWHFLQDAHRKSATLPQELRPQFLQRCQGAVTAVSLEQYEEFHTYMETLCASYPDMNSWRNWWHARRSHIFAAFRGIGYTGVNLAEMGNSGWKRPKPLPLVVACRDDIATMIQQEEDLSMYFKTQDGKAKGKGPNRRTKAKKLRKQQMDVALDFSSFIGDREATQRRAEEVNQPTTFMPGPKASHRPPRKSLTYPIQGSNTKDKEKKKALVRATARIIKEAQTLRSPQQAQPARGFAVGNQTMTQLSYNPSLQQPLQQTNYRVLTMQPSNISGPIISPPTVKQPASTATTTLSTASPNLQRLLRATLPSLGSQGGPRIVGLSKTPHPSAPIVRVIKKIIPSPKSTPSAALGAPPVVSSEAPSPPVSPGSPMTVTSPIVPSYHLQGMASNVRVVPPEGRTYAAGEISGSNIPMGSSIILPTKRSQVELGLAILATDINQFCAPRSLRREPLPQHPPMLVNLRMIPGVRKCQGCLKEITEEDKILHHFLAFMRDGYVFYYKKGAGNELQTRFQHCYFHLNFHCIKKKFQELELHHLHVNEKHLLSLTPDHFEHLKLIGVLPYILASTM